MMLNRILGGEGLKICQISSSHTLYMYMKGFKITFLLRGLKFRLSARCLIAHAATRAGVVCFYYFEKFAIFQNNKNKPFLGFNAILYVYEPL
jgi:hypothetical protein